MHSICSGLGGPLGPQPSAKEIINVASMTLNLLSKVIQTKLVQEGLKIFWVFLDEGFDISTLPL